MSNIVREELKERVSKYFDAKGLVSFAAFRLHRLLCIDKLYEVDINLMKEDVARLEYLAEQEVN